MKRKHPHRLGGFVIIVFHLGQKLISKILSRPVRAIAYRHVRGIIIYRPVSGERHRHVTCERYRPVSCIIGL